MSIWYIRHVNVNISVVCGNHKLQYIFFWCNFTFVEVEFSYLTALMILLMHKKTKVSVKYLRQSPPTWQKTSWCPVEDAHILSAESILEVSPTVSPRMWFHFTLIDVETQSWTAITAWQTCSISGNDIHTHKMSNKIHTNGNISVISAEILQANIFWVTALMDYQDFNCLLRILKSYPLMFAAHYVTDGWVWSVTADWGQKYVF